MHPYTLCGIAVALGIVACRGADSPRPGAKLTDPPPAPLTLTLTRLRSDSIAYALYSGVTTPQDLVIRDAAAWSALWALIHATQRPVPPLPDVDFGQEMIIAAALGTRSTGGYNVLLTQATEDASAVHIQVVETSPGPDCVTTQALSQPIDLARAPRRDAPVQFSIIQQVRHCGP